MNVKAGIGTLLLVMVAKIASAISLGATTRLVTLILANVTVNKALLELSVINVNHTSMGFQLMVASSVTAIQVAQRASNAIKMVNAHVMIMLKGVDVTDARKINTTDIKVVLTALIAIT